MVGLDGEQRAVVECEDSQVCIAGPGSGKTRVLTEKARRVLNSGESLLCLTFTRAAAREMGSRVQGVPAGTIHSYCFGRVGWKSRWGYPGLLYRYLQEGDEDKYDWVLVDEVQDLNELEMDVVFSLIGNKVFAVGDPYQSIYGFQGAMGPRAVRLFEKLGCRRVELRNNYRSCEEVVDRLNKVYRRELKSVNVKGNGLTFVLCRTNDDVFSLSEELADWGIGHKVRLSKEYGDDREYGKGVSGRDSKIKVMTIHQSKGLEADRVFLYGWKPEEWMGEEEERVYYVGMSRASKEYYEVGNVGELVRQLEGRREK